MGPRLTPRVYSPSSPEQMDWSTHYPAFKVQDDSTEDRDSNDTQPTKMSKQVEIADIGCGFGGLIVALSPLYPDTLMIGKTRLSLDPTIAPCSSLDTGKILTRTVQLHRHGTTHTSNRLRHKPCRCLTLSESTSTTINNPTTIHRHNHHFNTNNTRAPNTSNPLTLPKHLRPPHEHHEIPPKLLPPSLPKIDLPLLPRPALQTTQTQSPDSLPPTRRRIRIRSPARRKSIHHHRCGGASSVDG